MSIEALKAQLRAAQATAAREVAGKAEAEGRGRRVRSGAVWGTVPDDSAVEQEPQSVIAETPKSWAVLLIFSTQRLTAAVGPFEVLAVPKLARNSARQLRSLRPSRATSAVGSWGGCQVTWPPRRRPSTVLGPPARLQASRAVRGRPLTCSSRAPGWTLADAGAVDAGTPVDVTSREEWGPPARA